MAFKTLTPEEAARLIHNDDIVSFSGFTAAGTPKVVARAIADYAVEEHEAGRPFKISVITGASTNDAIDGALSRANAIKMRTPYQSHKDSRTNVNSGDISYFDMHLSHVSQNLRYGFLGKLKVAVIEVADINEKGEAILGTGLGATLTFCNQADMIIIEHNTLLTKEIVGIHDLYEPLDPPYRREIPIYKPSDRIGDTLLRIDPKKIVGIVKTQERDIVNPFAPVDETTMKIGQNVTKFLINELHEGRIPKEFLPVQSGVGNIANAVMSCLGASEEIPAFEMYTEVIQDSAMALIKTGKIKFASTCALTISEPMMEDFIANIEYYKERIILRPGEISNNPEVVRRLGLITMNTALEADIFGNVNSTHVMGSKMMNGIGGSADFTRNAYISIFSCPSIAKGGKISAIVPSVSHLDHSEHSVDILITEQGVADLRCKSPRERAIEIIENCAHPMYKPLLREYIKLANCMTHTPHDLSACFAFHQEFMKSGDMSKINWADYVPEECLEKLKD